MMFSNSILGQGIVEQTRAMMRVDATQYPVARIVASCNNWLDTITGYAIGADRRFQWDNTNQTALPIGTTNLVANQAEYSFLTDEQGNSIINLTRIDILDPSGSYRQLIPIDQAQLSGVALDEWNKTAGLPLYYDKTADNIIKLYPKPLTSVTNGLKFYFQRTSPYYVAADTTKTSGFSPLLDRGFVIASSYDGALSLGLANLQPLSIELQKEGAKMEQYFTLRETDEPTVITIKHRSSR